MSSPFKTKEFNKLKSQWYQKLRQNSFEDIEKDEYRLKEYHSSRFQSRYSGEEFKENERYWQLAGQLLHDYPFLNMTERIIWKMYIEGKNFNTISKHVKKSKATVYRIISRIAKVIKL